MCEFYTGLCFFKKITANQSLHPKLNVCDGPRVDGRKWHFKSWSQPKNDWRCLHIWNDSAKVKRLWSGHDFLVITTAPMMFADLLWFSGARVSNYGAISEIQECPKTPKIGAFWCFIYPHIRNTCSLVNFGKSNSKPPFFKTGLGRLLTW